MNHKRNLRNQVLTFAVLASFGVGYALQRPVLAQNEAVATGNGRLYVELKDATLYDAVQLVLRAAGNPGTYIVDATAKNANIGAVTFNNAQWDSIIRRLANESGFVVRINNDGSRVVEPRVIPNAEFGEFPGGAPDGVGLPGNPFGAPRGGRQPQFQAAPQTAPNLGRGGAANTEEPKEYRVLTVRHVYVGGIAQLFSNSDIISTETFLIPESALGGNDNGGGGGFGGGGFGNNNSGGGFGGGFGNNNSGGGFGGGGFGGGGGGFGGGGFGGGGIGGGIGGGGFGGF